MENVICTVVQEKTPEEFISVLNKYGVCTDYSNEYERTKTLQGIFVGVINKVYDVVWKGEGGHSEHDALFMSAKSLISNNRESQPFRVAFVGKIVSQLVEVNLKEGDGIAVLKPTFFYALDIPSLCVGAGNAVVWVAKGLKEQESNEDVAKTPDEYQCCQPQKKQSNGVKKNRKRIIINDDDSDTHSVGESSASGTLQHDIQIYRSRPVVLQRPPSRQLVPDSTTRKVVQRGQNNVCIENKSSPENIIGENIVSQNTPNIGSAADISCRNEIQSSLIHKLDSAVKFNKDLCCSCHNVANNTCGMHSYVTACKTNCCNSRVNFCNCHTIATNHFKENCCSHNNQPSCACNNRPSCAFINHQHCPCTRNCGYNAQPQCMQWNSAHSCRTNNSSCNKNLDHRCKSAKSCCGPCHSQTKQCCASHCQNVCMRSKHSCRKTNLEKANTTLCCNKQITAPFHCYNNSSCCCHHEKINNHENLRVSHCCGDRNEPRSKHDSYNEEVSIELSEESHKRSRTKQWVHNWVGEPPHLLPDIDESDDSETSKNPSLESRHIDKPGKSCNNQRPSHLTSSDPSDCVSKNKPQKPIAKKKKLFCPIDNSTIISVKSVCCNSIIVEESTPFDSENHTDTPLAGGLPSAITQDSKDKNENIPLSDSTILDNTLEYTITDPPTTNDASNSVASVRERLCSEKNAQETSVLNKPQNEEAQSGENKISSEEQFPELRIELPIVSEENTKSQNEENRKNISDKINRYESNIADHVEDLCLKENENSTHHVNKSNAIEKMSPNIEKDNNEECSLQKSPELQQRECGVINDFGTNEDCEANKSSNVEVTKIMEKNNKTSSCNKSLALQDHSKSRSVSHTEEMDSRMDFTLITDKTIDKEGMKRSKESSDDAMELTCESMLMKRRRKEKVRKTRSVGSLSSGKNANDLSGSSTGTYYDARSDGILSLRSNKWCLKPIKEVFEKPKIMKGLPSHSGSSYNLNLFSKFEVSGAIVNILPNLTQENFGSLVKGFCNEGCRTEYSYNEYKEMEPMNDKCTSCRNSYHLACPGCTKAGKHYPLCLYYNFEIHLFDGENVLRIEVDHKSGVDFLGCTPQMYLNSDTLYKKINKVIVSISQDAPVNPVLLKAKIKVMPKSGASVLTLVGTSLRKDLTLKGKHYKL